ncbi:hypothetical protein [Cellulophaga fucicola]|uniref:Uncharacterized protein n=1 Tax=Cellulophaga fucicola TaxID=76595 RepID=A0A1K1PJ55_9FLAO|nr:hypothetical protein [Cellulophaga fucicola]SFW47832.1 hypothetical protein SAMN05660313_01936 [Cellulophaga fucicola]
MNIIEKLKYHEDNQLDNWLDTDNKTTRKFRRDIASYAKNNFDEIKQYCLHIHPTDFSSLSIVYEALSEFSLDHNEFLYEEIQRITNLAINNKIDSENLNILTDIDMQGIYLKSLDIYIKIMNFLTKNLSSNTDSNYKIELLSVIDYYLIEVHKDDDILEFNNWINPIKDLASNDELSVKSEATKILKDLGVSDLSGSTSFVEKVLGIFD